MIRDKDVAAVFTAGLTRQAARIPFPCRLGLLGDYAQFVARFMTNGLADGDAIRMASR